MRDNVQSISCQPVLVTSPGLPKLSVGMRNLCRFYEFPAIVRGLGFCFMEAAKAVLKRYPEIDSSHCLVFRIFEKFCMVRALNVSKRGVGRLFAFIELSHEHCQYCHLCISDSPKPNVHTVHRFGTDNIWC